MKPDKEELQKWEYPEKVCLLKLLAGAVKYQSLDDPAECQDTQSQLPESREQQGYQQDPEKELGEEKEPEQYAVSLLVVGSNRDMSSLLNEPAL